MSSPLSLAETVVQQLSREKKSLAVAESCTGGLVSKTLTDIPGASSVFWGGVVVYSNEAKERLLSLPKEVLEQYGAVSEECASSMALQMLNISGASMALSLTGVAGPTGGSREKPVGTLFLGIASDSSVKCFKKVVAEKSRSAIRSAALSFSLETVLCELGAESGSCCATKAAGKSF